MTLPVNIRVLSKVNFPTQVYGSGFVQVTKANGRWTIGSDFSSLAPLLSPFDPTVWNMPLENFTTKQFASLSLFALLAATENVYREVTAAGPVTIGAADVGILLNKTVGAQTDIDLPTSASRNGVPVWVKDYKGDSNVNNVRFVMAGAETVDGFNQAAADANGRSKLALAYGTKTLWPRQAGGWYIRQ